MRTDAGRRRMGILFREENQTVFSLSMYPVDPFFGLENGYIVVGTIKYKSFDPVPGRLCEPFGNTICIWTVANLWSFLTLAACIFNPLTAATFFI